MNVFVLGGEGFVGSAFVRAAAKRHQAAAITRRNYEQFRGKACDLLINANGNSKKYLADQNPTGEFDASVASVLRSLLDFPAKRYVYLSTIDVYPCVDDPRRNRETAAIDPAKLSRYGLHKYLAEQLVRKYAASWLICRLGGMVGEGLWKNSIYDILHGQPLRVHAESEYQFMNTDDVAKVVFALVRQRHENEVFNVCGADCVSLAKVARLAGNFNIRYTTGHPRKERYEVSIAKLQSRVAVPSTLAQVQKFMRNRDDGTPSAGAEPQAGAPNDMRFQVPGVP
jgi:nucleoside-diphosphate-sugar epimerase